MAKRKGGGMRGGGGLNMQSMMQQAQKMQQDIAGVQEALAEKEIEATAGGGMVKAVVTGAKQLKILEIAEEVVDPEDVEMLQDLVIAAVNEAMQQAEQYADEEMAKVTGGANLGGLF